MIVTFQGLEFRSTAMLKGSTDGFVIGPDGWEGWDDPAGVRRPSGERPADGSYAPRAYRTDRLVTMSGAALADYPGDLKHLQRRFAALDAGYHKLAVFDGRETQWALASLNASTFRPYGDLGEDAIEADFSLELWCPDPWRYGDTRTATATQSGGPVQLVNRGTQNAWPVIRLQGPLASPVSLSLAGRSLRVAQALTSSQWIEIDTRTGSATTNAVAGGRLFSEVTGRMPVLPPGVRTFTWTGNGSVKFTWADTYV